MAVKLTALSVDGFKPDPTKRLEIGDALVPGLYLVIQPSGKKSWAVRYRHGGKPAKLTIGPAKMVSLEAARNKARDALEQVARGLDPSDDKKAAKAVAPVAADAPGPHWLYWRVVESFNSVELVGLRSGAQVYRRLERETKEVWGSKPIGEITKRDVRVIVDGIKAGNGRKRGPAPVQAARVLSYISWFFAWALRRDFATANPCVGIEKPTNDYERRRQRLLEDRELSEVWKAAGDLGYPFGDIVRMLMLTGCRLREVAEAEWSEFDIPGRTWTIPPHRAKNGDAHTVGLSEPALQILAAVPRIGEMPRFVFSTTGLTPVSGFDRAKKRLDAALAALDEDRIKLGEAFAPRQPWVFHDLRRSVASGLARLRVPFEVVERVLAHRGESQSGLRAVYNRHSYENEKREALTLWADHIAALARESTRNVVRLRAVGDLVG